MNKFLRFFTVVTASLLLTLSVGCGKKEADQPAAKQSAAQTQAAKAETTKAEDITPLAIASYNFGTQMGAYVKQNLGDNVDMESLTQGVRDGAAGKAPRYTQEQTQAAIEYLNEQREKLMAEEKVVNLAKGKKFLAENGKRDGVKTTESGLQYEVLVAVDAGESPSATDVVTTHYHGTLIDGSVFDSSYDRGEPIEFPLNRVISGWTEALQLMKVGEKFRIYLPAELAYGEDGRPPQIPGNSVLIFDIELIEFKQ